MRFVVDGYNVTKGDPATRGLSLAEQRLALTRRLGVRAPDLLGRGPVTVVFDGRLGMTGGQDGAGVEVRFSRDEAADDLIVRLLGSASDAATLVTSDVALAERAREAAGGGVRVLPRETLYEGAAARKPRGKGRPGGSTSGMPKGANRITEELKKLWLDGEE